MKSLNIMRETNEENPRRKNEIDEEKPKRENETDKEKPMRENVIGNFSWIRKKVELASKENKDNAQGHPNSDINNSSKLIPHQGANEDVLEYFVLFEKTAELHNINKDQWHLIINWKFNEKTRHISKRLSIADMQSYDKIKEELMKHFKTVATHTLSEVSKHRTNSERNLRPTRYQSCKTTIAASISFSSVASNIWNALPNHLSSISTLLTFRGALKHHLFLLAHPDSSAKSGEIKPAQCITLRDSAPTTATAPPRKTVPPI